MTQWDGQHYLSIASDGYQIEPCAPGYPPNFICGNVGWFPGYPVVVSLISWLPIAQVWSLLIVSWLTFLTGLGLLYCLIQDIFDRKTAIVSLLALFCFPPSFYFLTGFPYSLYFLLSVIIFYLLRTEQYSRLILPTVLLALTYPSGLVITLPMGYILLTEWKTLSGKNKISLITAIFSAGFALIMFAGYYWLAFNNFFLYQDFQAQSLYSHTLSFPLIPLAKILSVSPAQVFSDLHTVLQSPLSNYLIEYRYVTVWLTIILLVLVLILFYNKKIPVTWHIYIWGIILFTPTFGTTDCYYRHIIIAWPLFVMIGVQWQKPKMKWLIPVMLITGIILMLWVFLPLYKMGQLM